MDNLNTHTPASHYKPIEPEEARPLGRLARILLHAKHGGWLNVFEIKLSVLNVQSLDPHIAEMATLRAAITAWKNDRNNCQTKIEWQFTTADVPIKLKSLYPKL